MNESLLHFGHRGMKVQILSFLGISFSPQMDFAFRCIDVGFLLPPLPPLPPRLLFEEAGASRIVEATVSNACLKVQPSF